MYLKFAIVVWITSLWFSYANGGRRLPFSILALGCADLVAIYYYGLGAIGTAILACLSVVMLISLKVDTALKSK